MRHLIDTYIEAEAPRRISDFGEIGLVDLIVRSGIAEAVKSLPTGIQSDPRAVAETIANNVRSKIIREHLNDPAFYDRMSALLAEVLADLKAQRIDYAEFLRRIAERIVAPLAAGREGDAPVELDTPGKRALYNNVSRDAHPLYEPDPPGAALVLALQIDETVRRVRPNAWRGNQAKENVIKAALLPLLRNDPADVERVFLIIKAQPEY